MIFFLKLPMIWRSGVEKISFISFLEKYKNNS
jgi:hypothetical protein